MSITFASPCSKTSQEYSLQSNACIKQLKETPRFWYKEFDQACQLVLSTLADSLTHACSIKKELLQITQLTFGPFAGKSVPMGTVGQHVECMAFHLLRTLVHLAEAGICVVLAPVLVVKPRLVVPLHEILQLNRSWGFPLCVSATLGQRLLCRSKRAVCAVVETICSHKKKILVLPTLAGLAAGCKLYLDRVPAQPKKIFQLGYEEPEPISSYIIPKEAGPFLESYAVAALLVTFVVGSICLKLVDRYQQRKLERQQQANVRLD